MDYLSIYDFCFGSCERLEEEEMQYARYVF